MIKISRKKLEEKVLQNGKNQTDKCIYDLILSPLERGSYSKEGYINYLKEMFLDEEAHLEMLKAVLLDGIDAVHANYQDFMKWDKEIKETEVNKENIYTWFYKMYIEDNNIPEPSNYWVEGGLDDNLEEVLKDFTIGEKERISHLIAVFWDEVDVLFDDDNLVKGLITELYHD